MSENQMNEPRTEIERLATELTAAANRAIVAAQALNDATKRFDRARAELRVMLRELRGDSEIILLKPN